jgi:branched-chain amino acid transport system permease protein
MKLLCSKQHNSLATRFILPLILLSAVPIFVKDEYFLHILIAIYYNCVYAACYRFVLRTGQFHFGAHGYIGIGAYSSALLVTRLEFSFWLAFPLSGIIAGLMAVIVGYPVLRLKGLYFAIITWGFADSLLFLYKRVKNPFGGIDGLSFIPSPNPIHIPWIGTLDFNDKAHFYILALILMLFALYVLYRMERSRFGLIFNAIREGDHIVRTVGINIMTYKVLAFAVCSCLSGMAGSFYAHYTYYISPNDFTVILTIFLAIYSVVGGLERFSGVIIGTVILSIAGEIFSSFAQYQIILYSGFMILILLLVPGGLSNLPSLISNYISKLKRTKMVGRKNGASGVNKSN